MKAPLSSSVVCRLSSVKDFKPPLLWNHLADWRQISCEKRVREKSMECHNHKPQPFQDTKRKKKSTKTNKQKSNKRTKSPTIRFLFPKRGNRNAKRTEKRKNKITQGKTQNQSPRRINHKATKSRTNTETTALERSVNYWEGGGGGRGRERGCG